MCFPRWAKELQWFDGKRWVGIGTREMVTAWEATPGNTSKPMGSRLPFMRDAELQHEAPVGIGLAMGLVKKERHQLGRVSSISAVDLKQCPIDFPFAHFPEHTGRWLCDSNLGSQKVVYIFRLTTIPSTNREPDWGPVLNHFPLDGSQGSVDGNETEFEQGWVCF